MSRRPRRNHAAAFKANVALEALRDDMTRAGHGMAGSDYQEEWTAARKNRAPTPWPSSRIFGLLLDRRWPHPARSRSARAQGSKPRSSSLRVAVAVAHFRPLGRGCQRCGTAADGQRPRNAA